MAVTISIFLPESRTSATLEMQIYDASSLVNSTPAPMTDENGDGYFTASIVGFENDQVGDKSYNVEVRDTNGDTFVVGDKLYPRQTEVGVVANMFADSRNGARQALVDFKLDAIIFRALDPAEVELGSAWEQSHTRGLANGYLDYIQDTMSRQGLYENGSDPNDLAKAFWRYLRQALIDDPDGLGIPAGSFADFVDAKVSEAGGAIDEQAVANAMRLTPTGTVETGSVDDSLQKIQAQNVILDDKMGGIAGSGQNTMLGFFQAICGSILTPSQLNADGFNTQNDALTVLRGQLDLKALEATTQQTLTTGGPGPWTTGTAAGAQSAINLLAPTRWEIVPGQTVQFNCDVFARDENNQPIDTDELPVIDAADFAGGDLNGNWAGPIVKLATGHYRRTYNVPEAHPQTDVLFTATADIATAPRSDFDVTTIAEPFDPSELALESTSQTILATAMTPQTTRDAMTLPTTDQRTSIDDQLDVIVAGNDTNGQILVTHSLFWENDPANPGLKRYTADSLAQSPSGGGGTGGYVRGIETDKGTSDFVETEQGRLLGNWNQFFNNSNRQTARIVDDVGTCVGNGNGNIILPTDCNKLVIQDKPLVLVQGDAYTSATKPLEWAVCWTGEMPEGTLLTIESAAGVNVVDNKAGSLIVLDTKTLMLLFELTSGDTNQTIGTDYKFEIKLDFGLDGDSNPQVVTVRKGRCHIAEDVSQ